MPTRRPFSRPYPPINLALQEAAHMARFAWGVMDRLIEDGRIDFDGISGTSAGR